ncbi:MAG TPA: hypothetical protein VL359_08000, partial [bacterium]|nr:hypothetical protein [bacterium]
PGLYPLALPYVEFWVPPGTAAGIGAFYADCLGCPVEKRPVAEDVAVRVTVGTYQEFRFRERPDATVVQSRNHVAIYMTRYKATYDRLLERDLIMEEDVGDQFRFCKMVEPASGRGLFVFEHEVRSLFHEGFRRRLVNRYPMPERID